mmetsp:Transcript_40163/g.89111  ORF Transcript_40163/g.89111 Transcript_40163/m.89111 type:complete len:386 (-) Transcript_40163:647-1804(-)
MQTTAMCIDASFASLLVLKSARSMNAWKLMVDLRIISEKRATCLAAPMSLCCTWDSSAIMLAVSCCRCNCCCCCDALTTSWEELVESSGECAACLMALPAEGPAGRFLPGAGAGGCCCFCCCLYLASMVSMRVASEVYRFAPCAASRMQHTAHNRSARIRRASLAMSEPFAVSTNLIAYESSSAVAPYRPLTLTCRSWDFGICRMYSQASMNIKADSTYLLRATMLQGDVTLPRCWSALRLTFCAASTFLVTTSSVICSAERLDIVGICRSNGDIDRIEFAASLCPDNSNRGEGRIVPWPACTLSEGAAGWLRMLLVVTTAFGACFLVLPGALTGPTNSSPCSGEDMEYAKVVAWSELLEPGACTIPRDSIPFLAEVPSLPSSSA